MPQPDSCRESGSADPTTSEVKTTPSETNPSEPAVVKAKNQDHGDGANNAVKPKVHKKPCDKKSRKAKPARKCKAKARDSEASPDDSSSSESEEEEDSGSSSEGEETKIRSRAKSGTGTRAAKKSSQRAKKAKKKTKSSKAQTYQSDGDESESSEMSGSDGGKIVISRHSRNRRRNQSQQLSHSEILLQLQELTQMMAPNQDTLQADPLARLIPGGAGQGPIPDLGSTPAVSQTTLLQSLVNAQAILLRGLGAQIGKDVGQTSSLQGGRGGPAGVAPAEKKKKKTIAKTEEASHTGLEYKRVDQVWNTSIHDYELQNTAHASVSSQHEGFVFFVRRLFDWEGKYNKTYIDIISKFLRECLREVIGNVKGVSLVEETPKLDPNLLFL
jgi:hypothetical protein